LILFALAPHKKLPLIDAIAVPQHLAQRLDSGFDRRMESTERTVGSYQLLGELGRGAMGVVHRARHRETGAVVALKTLHAPRPALSDALQREIYALSKLSHPNIVSIIEF
jgi:serine/threonine protein kinase